MCSSSWVVLSCVQTDAEILTLALFLIAKCTIAGGTMIIFQFGGELYPTVVRGVGIGLASFLGGIGLTLIPFINYLGTQWLVLPIVMMGSFSIAGGIVTLKLPETLGAKLPQTLEEGEDFGKDFEGWADTIQQISRWLKPTFGPFWLFGVCLFRVKLYDRVLLWMKCLVLWSAGNCQSAQSASSNSVKSWISSKLVVVWILYALFQHVNILKIKSSNAQTTPKYLVYHVFIIVYGGTRYTQDRLYKRIWPFASSAKIFIDS